MAWLQVHQSLIDHKKTLEAAASLDLHQMQVVGHILALWLWALDSAPDGQLAGILDRTIARAARYDGDSTTFVAVLHGVGFLDEIDGGYEIHDWEEYVGNLMDRRAVNAERQKRFRETRKSTQTDRNALRNTQVTQGVTRYVTPVSRGRVEKSRAEQSREDPGSLAVADAPASETAGAVGESVKAETPRKPHPYQEQIDALQEALDVRRIDALTTTEQGKLFRAAKLLGDAKRSKADILTARANWFSHATCTALGIAGNITDLLRAPPRASPNGSSRPNYSAGGGTRGESQRQPSRYEKLGFVVDVDATAGQDA